MSRGVPDIRRLASHFLLDREETADPIEELGRDRARLGLVQVKDPAARLSPTDDLNDAAGVIEFVISGSLRTNQPEMVSSASYYVLDVAYIIVSPGSLFSREFAGVTGLVFKAIRGGDVCTRDFGCGRYENLSGAISWLTFFAGGAATSGEPK